MLGKKLINSGPSGGGGGANTFASENFNTVLYTGNGSTQRIGGYINRGAVFSGSGSYIQTALPSSSIYALSFWLYFESGVTQYTPFGTDVGSGAGDIVTELGTNGSFAITIQNKAYGKGAGALGSTGWKHIAYSSDQTLYINGVLQTGGSTVTNSNPSANLLIGSWNNTFPSWGAFNSKLDQIRVFNRNLTSSEVTTLYGETFASASKSVTDIFNDNSAVALYQLDGNANDTGGLDYVFTTWDSTLSSVPNYSEGNLRMTGGSGNKIGYSVDSVSSGKWYWEHEVIAIGAESSFGIARPGDLGSHYVVGTTSTSWGLYVNGNSYHNGSISTSGYMSGGFSNGDIIGVELDLDNGTIEFYKNGTGYGNAFTGLTGSFLVAAESRTSSGINDHRTNFGATAWDYTPSTGFAGINTEYNGTASNVTYQEATNFSPDLVIVKSRNTGEPFMWRDSVRGGNATRLFSDRTAISSVFTPDSISSFDSNGFTCGGNGGRINSSSNNYAAWCFNAGEDAPATNNDGTISSTVKANPEAGFSIVTFTSSNSTASPPPMNYMGHGLDAAPEMVIYKRLDATQHWVVQHDGVTTNGGLHLDLTNAQSGPFTYDFFDNTTTTIGVRSNYAISRNGSYIAYNFHSVDGYQKIGSYTGTGASGNIIETGFEPAFIMIKRTDSTSSWYILDNKRIGSNGYANSLYANLTNVEETTQDSNGYYPINFLSNGFEILQVSNGYNASGGTYIYLAIAADPDTTTPTVENSFDVVTYTGNGSTQEIATDFKPDLVWIKSRNHANNHFLYDSIRGVSKAIYIQAETEITRSGVTSFDTNGFTLGSSNDMNLNNNTFVAWCWKAGDHDDNLPQINTEGTIDSIVSVNDAAGFSIVKHIGNGILATIGHGLSSAPELIIYKQTSSSAVGKNWVVYASPLGNTKGLILNLSYSAFTDADAWNNTTPTSTVFSVGAGDDAYGTQTNVSGKENIAYCFTSIAGYQKIGTYNGGSSGSSNVITTGFKPRFLLVKRTDAAGDAWQMFDSIRGGGDTFDNYVQANSSAAETSYSLREVNFSNDGFYWTNAESGTNISGGTYIYLAIK